MKTFKEFILEVNRPEKGSDEERKRCFHYTNLQPLTKKANRIKSNKL